MSLSELLFENFRNLPQTNLKFHPKLNFITGKNGSGKTNLLEAIFYLGHGRSFKNTPIQRIIQEQQNQFTLHGKIQENNLNWSIGLQSQIKTPSIVKINGKDGNKISDLARLLPIQIIDPESLNFFNAGPTKRRAFLDWGLFHNHVDFYPAWIKWRRILKQRNAALNQATSYAQVRIWDLELAQAAEKLTQWRSDYINNLHQYITENCNFFLPEVEIKLSFFQGWDKTKNYFELLEHNFSRDKELKYTASGPQKADLKLRIAGADVEDVLSRGQLKLLICALKLAQGQYLMQTQQRHCIFLIDDLASELDQSKQDLLAKKLLVYNSQIFISAIHQNQLTSLLTEPAHIFTLEQGTIKVTNTTE